MAIYTIILQFNEGTYISQISAGGTLEAMRKWLASIDVTVIDRFSENEKRRLIQEDFEDEKPILIQGCINVWCFCLRIENELAMINMVKTSIE